MTDTKDVLDDSDTLPEPTEPSLMALKAFAKEAGEPAKVLKVRDEPAFVLRTWPWKESSVIAECFTKRHGRQVMSVRGAKRPGGRFRGLINPFSPLIINYNGAGEVKNLTVARWLGGLTPLAGDALLSGFYINELVLKLTEPADPQPALFDAYTRTLKALAEGTAVQQALRIFEVDLLRILGGGKVPGPVKKTKTVWWRAANWFRSVTRGSAPLSSPLCPHVWHTRSSHRTSVTKRFLSQHAMCCGF